MVKKAHTAVVLRARRLWIYIRAHRRAVILGVLCMLLGSVLGVFVLKTALPVAIAPITKHVVTEPLVLKLNQNIGNLDTDKIQLSPKVEGTWRHERSTLMGSDTLVFTPRTYFSTNSTYDVSFPRINRHLIGDSDIKRYSFTTEPAPSITTTGVSALTANAVVPADYQPTVMLSSPNRKLRDIILKTTPEIDFSRTLEKDTKYTWKSSTLLPQGAPITLEFYDTKNNVSLLKKTVMIAAEPRLTSTLNRSYVNNGDTVTLEFDQPIDTSSADIDFTAPGNGIWKSETSYAFTTKDLKPATSYTYALKAGLRSKSGGILTAEQKGTLQTTGLVTIAKTYPEGGNASAVEQRIAITFDQPVNRDSVGARLSTSTGTLEQLSWQGNTLSAVLKNAGYQQTITINIAAGVMNAGFGLPSATNQSYSFTTEVRTVRMAVPHFRQVFKASCTAASLRMALAYRGIASDDMSLITQMGYAPRSKVTSTDPATWDDPNEMFVGSVDGSITGGTGAGPDAPPVAKAARAFGRNADAVTGIDAYWIARQIHAGNPVVMFGAQKNTGMTSWVTPSGRLTTMNLTGHATTVLGVVGEADAPLGFWVSDPLAYGPQYWTLAAVANNIARDPYRQAVVVY